ncbi:MAG: peptide-binding protein [Deltaproteobacteria bacterium]|nr:peptide-binding protein [Deltaproteobacteria bacterium]
MRNKSTLFSLFLILLTGCHFQVPKDPSILIWHLGAEPDTLNPILATDAYAGTIDNFIYETLIERDNATLAWRPKLATRWEISPDHRQFTYTLRDDVFWHDGTPFTTDDILYSFEKIMDPAVDDPHLKVYYKDILKVEKLSPVVVRFTYREPYFLALEFTGTIPIIPKHLYQGTDFNKNPLNRTPIGTGPFRFLSWKTGDRIRIARNEGYWREKPALHGIDFEIVAEDTVALQVLKKGGLDFAGLRPIQWVRQTGSSRFNNRFEKRSYTTPGYSFIGWNNKKPFFKDKRVRRAMTFLINRQQILEKLNFGLGRVVTGPAYVDSLDYNPQIEPIPYDPDKAKELLAQAGWRDTDHDGWLDKNGVPFRFEFLISSGRRFAERLATILKEDFAGVGIDMEIRKLEWALFIKNLDDRKFDAVTLGWVFGFEQDPYQVWHSSQAVKGSNFVGFENREADTLIEMGRREFDRQKRANLYRRFHQIVDEEQPYTFLYASPHLLALDRRFENVQVYPAGVDPLEWTVRPVLELE